MPSSKTGGDSEKGHIPNERKRTVQPNQVNALGAGGVAPASESQLGRDISRATFERHAALLGDKRLYQPMYTRRRAMMMQQLQRGYGNRYVQRLIDHISRHRGDVVQTEPGAGPTRDTRQQEANSLTRKSVGMINGAGEQTAQRLTVGVLANGGNVIQRLPPDQIEVGKRYRYTDNGSGEEKVGTLQIKGGGWYTFNNGRARGANNVLALDEPADEGPAPMEGVKEGVAAGPPAAAAPPTAAKIISDLAAAARIQNPVLLSLVVDLTNDEIRQASIQMVDMGQSLLKLYLADWTKFTACYDTAVRLFRLLQSSETKARARATRGNKKSLIATAASLCKTVAEVVDRGAIFRVACGIHGFTILARHGRAELLQSFAGEAGEMLATNLAADKQYSVGDVIELLTNMVSEDAVARGDAQNELFGGGIEDDENTWPDIDFEWEAADLPDAGEIAGRVAAKIAANLKLVEQARKQWKRLG